MCWKQECFYGEVMSWLASYWTTRVILNCNVIFGPYWWGGSHKHQVSCNFDKVHLLEVLCLVGGSNKAMKRKEGDRSTIEVLRYNVNVFANQFIDQCWWPKLYNKLLQETVVCWVPSLQVFLQPLQDVHIFQCQYCVCIERREHARVNQTMTFWT